MKAASDSKRWRVTILRWDVYEARNVEAATEDSAEEQALDLFETTDDLLHVDGGVNSVNAEEEEE